MNYKLVLVDAFSRLPFFCGIPHGSLRNHLPLLLPPVFEHFFRSFLLLRCQFRLHRFQVFLEKHTVLFDVAGTQLPAAVEDFVKAGPELLFLVFGQFDAIGKMIGEKLPGFVIFPALAARDDDAEQHDHTDDTAQHTGEKQSDGTATGFDFGRQGHLEKSQGIEAEKISRHRHDRANPVRDVQAV